MFDVMTMKKEKEKEAREQAISLTDPAFRRTEREKLQKAPQKSGEEDEETELQHTGKLYVFDKEKWADRGKGAFKINTSRDGSVSRILMRGEKTLRLMLNVRITKDLQISKSDKAIRFIAPSPDDPATLETCSVKVIKDKRERERERERRKKKASHLQSSLFFIYQFASNDIVAEVLKKFEEKKAQQK
jgi:hypothetical protein